MIAIPALELRNGACVRGSTADDASAFPLDDPITAARGLADAGFARIQVVDGDAVNGIGSNAALLDDVIRDAGVDVQANGGLQTDEAILRLIDAGASRIVLGTRALAEPDWLASVAESNPGVLIVETALRDRRVLVRGWVRSLPLDIFDIIEDLDGLPLAGLAVGAYLPDGNRGATDLGLLEDIAEASPFPVLATGGILSMSDLRALEHRGVSGAIIPVALFASELDPRSVAREFGL